MLVVFNPATLYVGFAVATKYLNYFPKPLLDDLVNGRWLPVIGAGMSLNASMPPHAKMPLWGELSKLFADELKDYSPTSALDAISAYEHEIWLAARLIERLAELLHLNKRRNLDPPTRNSAACRSISFVRRTSTSYWKISMSGLSTPWSMRTSLSINIGSAGTLLLELHGDLRHPKRLVVTEADYDGFLANYPLIATYLSNQLITKTAVFVGYSLEDPDFRQIWHVVSDRLGKTRRMAYAILSKRKARRHSTVRASRR